MTPTYCGGIMRPGGTRASDHHDVCVLDAATGHRVAEFRVAHTAAGLAELRTRLARFGEPGALPLALERPSGLLVDTLLEAGHPVGPIHPNALKASRPPAGGL